VCTADALVVTVLAGCAIVSGCATEDRSDLRATQRTNHTQPQAIAEPVEQAFTTRPKAGTDSSDNVFPALLESLETSAHSGRYDFPTLSEGYVTVVPGTGAFDVDTNTNSMSEENMQQRADQFGLTMPYDPTKVGGNATPPSCDFQYQMVDGTHCWIVPMNGASIAVFYNRKFSDVSPDSVRDIAFTAQRLPVHERGVFIPYDEYLGLPEDARAHGSYVCVPEGSILIVRTRGQVNQLGAEVSPAALAILQVGYLPLSLTPVRGGAGGVQTERYNMVIERMRIWR